MCVICFCQSKGKVCLHFRSEEKANIISQMYEFASQLLLVAQVLVCLLLLLTEPLWDFFCGFHKPVQLLQRSHLPGLASGLLMSCSRPAPACCCLTAALDLPVLTPYRIFSPSQASLVLPECLGCIVNFQKFILA